MHKAMRERLRRQVDELNGVPAVSPEDTGAQELQVKEKVVDDHLNEPTVDRGKKGLTGLRRRRVKNKIIK